MSETTGSVTVAAGVLGLVACVALGGPAPALAQVPTELIAQGRYEQAVAMLPDAVPEEAERTAEAIFRAAHANGYEAGDFVRATRGFQAAKQLRG